MQCTMLMIHMEMVPKIYEFTAVALAIWCSPLFLATDKKKHLTCYYARIVAALRRPHQVAFRLEVKTCLASSASLLTFASSNVRG